MMTMVTVRVAIVALMVLSTVLGLAWAGEPPSEPILRIETGIHTGEIMGIGMDVANRFLVTGSYDKTVRVWDLATGRQLSILRPPMGEGKEGKINTVAMSPDGQTIAVAGWTGLDWEGKASIYLFDRTSSNLRQRVIVEVPRGIGCLAFSPDGRWMVSTLGGENGIRIYRTTDYALAAEDRDYRGNSYRAAFDASGRLATTSYDGFVRLYDQSFRLVAKQKAPGGSHPHGISFSPDGSRLAVGFDDSTQVNVLSGLDLSLSYSPDTSGVTNGFLANVAWSADGRRLSAGGGYDVNGMSVVRQWDDGGRGRATDIPASPDVIRSLMPLADGSLAYGAADASFGILDSSGRKVLSQGGQVAKFGAYQTDFLLSLDGKTVQFGYKNESKDPAQFHVAGRLLDTGAAIAVAKGSPFALLTPPRTQELGLSVTDWIYTTNPKLNGQPLPLKQYEVSHSLAIAPNTTRFILGTQWRLLCFDRSGKEQWQLPLPWAIVVVNISDNGQVVVAALADGTIRWYRLSDGKELLALFPHADQKRWVLWTPSGYYDASPGAEELIGWHVNRGKDQAADFFPAAQFRNTYYRPDVVAKVLETLDEGEAIRAVNADSNRKAPTASLTQQLPPVVTILSPSEGTATASTEVLVRFTVRSPSGEPITGIKALVDGRPITVVRDLKVTAKAQAESDVQELRVTIPERDAEIAILADNRFATSVPAKVRVTWRGVVPSEAFVIKPKLYVLAIGVSQYQNKDLTLGFAAKDASDFATVLTQQQGRLYREVVVRSLTNAQATKDNILDDLDWIQKETTSKDVAMVFLAGHGVNDPTGNYYFLPTNADPDKLKRTGLAFTDLKNTLASIAGKAVLFVDTCHSGNIMGIRRGGADINAVVNELSSAENGTVVFAASTGKQYSLEDQAWGNGAFTKALVEGLGGKADYSGKGTISINMLDLYLSERVKELTGGKQTPTTTKPTTIQDFPVALRR